MLAAELFRQPGEQVIVDSAGWIRSGETGPGGMQAIMARRERSATNTRAGAPSNIRVKRLYSERREAR